MAEGLLKHALAARGIEARVHSAGLLDDGRPASTHGVDVLRSHGIDLGKHRSRRFTVEMVREADLVIGMARQHVREAVVQVPAAWPRSFTLKELVRRGSSVGPRRSGEALADWLIRVHAGRRASEMLGDDEHDDVFDPIGSSRSRYEATASELEGLVHRLVEMAFPLPPLATDPSPEVHPMTDRDEQLFAIVERELERQMTTLQLIASENFASPQVIEATGSVLTNKYSEGYPGKRYYGGNAVIDEVEELARDRVKSLFGAEHANVQPHSGANANTAVYLALLEPGDTVMGLRLDQGGHITHGLPVSLSGKFYNWIAYGLTESDERIDFDQVREQALAHRPKLIVAGATAYPRIIDPQPFREIADEVGALLMFDAAHIAGLIAGGVHPSPVELADVVTFTTHKTLRGPRGGCILSKAEHADAIDRAVFPGTQGGPLEHVIAAKAVAFWEAAQPSFRQYAEQILTNARALAAALAAEGVRLVSGGTDNHLMLADLRTFDADLSGKKARLALDRAGITLNENTVPNDPRPPFTTSGLRLGTAAVTTAGMGEAEMEQIAALIGRVLRTIGDKAEERAVREDVATLCSKFPPYPVG